MTRSDSILHADPRWINAQRGANRDRSRPVHTPRVLVGHLPDPRVVPAPVSKARWHTITSFIALAAFVGLVWWALLSLGGA